MSLSMALSWDIPANAGFLSDKAAGLSNKKKRPFSTQKLGWREREVLAVLVQPIYVSRFESATSRQRSGTYNYKPRWQAKQRHFLSEYVNSGLIIWHLKPEVYPKNMEHCSFYVMQDILCLCFKRQRVKAS